jgi:hypothetical protein
LRNKKVRRNSASLKFTISLHLSGCQHLMKYEAAYRLRFVMTLPAKEAPFPKGA